MTDPRQTATFRFEMIAPLVDQTLDKRERRKLLAERTGHPVRWPTGDERPVPRSTLLRWLAAYRKGGFTGLLPRARKDRGKPRKDRAPWIEKAVQLLLERPSRSLTLLLEFLRSFFPDHDLTRSTLERELKRHPVYPALRALCTPDRKLRRRFQAPRPHMIWQLDGKGSFLVRLADGRVLRVTVLTVLDDATRAVLAVGVALTENLGVAVRVVRSAISRWGLPDRIYADRHSVYDSDVFRTGLAILGIHRIRSRAGNAPARGKIEAYHRTLVKWFVRELPHQSIVDCAHLEELLVALIETVYQTHRHRGLKMSPTQALDGKRAKREAAPEDLRRAFIARKKVRSHKKTGEVNLPGGSFIVPKRLAGTRVEVFYDPSEPARAWIAGAKGEETPLACAFSQPAPAKAASQPPRGAGTLQRLLDSHRGRSLPQATPGFGLPEVLDALTEKLGRRIPATEREARAVRDFWRVHGPFGASAFQAALVRALETLGPARPLAAWLDFLARLIKKQKPDPAEDPLRKEEKSP